MLRCGGCGEVVSEWAPRCGGCARTTADADPVPGPLADLIAEVGAALLGADRRVAGATSPAAADAATDADGIGNLVTVAGGAPPPVGVGRGKASARGGVHRRAALAGSAAALAVAVGALVAVRNGSAPLAVPGGTVLSYDQDGDLEATTASGATHRVVPPLDGSGLVVAPDGRDLATGEGEELRGPGIVATGRSVPFDGPPGSWRAVGFADGDRALAGTETGVDGLTHVEVAAFSGSGATQFGTALSAVGDPGAFGVFAVVDDDRGDPGVVRRDRAQPEAPLVTGPALLTILAQAGDHEVVAVGPSVGARSIAVSVLPSPDGARVAILVAGFGGIGFSGVVVMDRHGGLVGSTELRPGTTDVPAWSPDGLSLVLPAPAGQGRPAAVETWRPGQTPVLSAVPSAIARPLGACIWGSDTVWLCASTPPPGDQASWLLGRPGGPVEVRRGPELPFAWIPT